MGKICGYVDKICVDVFMIWMGGNRLHVHLHLYTHHRSDRELVQYDSTLLQ